MTSRVVAMLLVTAAMLVLGVMALPSLPGGEPAAHALQFAAQHRAIDRNAPSTHIPPHDVINEVFLLRESNVISLDLPEEDVLPQEFSVHMPLHGQQITLQLHVFSNRSDDHRVRIQIDDGSLVDIDPGPVNTYRGIVPEIPGTIVAAGLVDGALHGMLQLPEGSRYLIEPVSYRIPGVHRSQHVLYDARNADCESDRCGVPDHWQPEVILPDEEQAGADEAHEAEGGIAGNQCMQVLIAIDADFPFYQTHNSNTTSTLNRINAVMNNTNAIYENEVGIRHWINEIIIRTSATANPYSGPATGNQCPSGSGSGSNLLSQFRNVWTSPPESSIQRNIAHLFTGCAVDVGGIAYLSAVCKPIGHAFNPPYSLARHQSTLSCATHVTAHELGHNWSATHCDCFGTIMFATFPPCITSFAQISKNQILNYANSASGSCTTECGEPQPQPPSNDACTGSIVASEGFTAFNNELATTTGPNEPNVCNFDGSTQVESDVWFRHTAQCTGDLTVSLCDTFTSFDTKLALYGAICPQGPGTAIACNKDACGVQSSVTISVNQGQIIRIRIGGHNNAQGVGEFEITCVPKQDPCPADLNNDNKVDGFDLLLLLGDWGDCSNPNNCPADLDNNGKVDGFDLLMLLGAWGDCP